MSKKMTEAKWSAVLTATRRGIDAVHDEEHDAMHDAVAECKECQEAYEGLQILLDKFYSKYIKSKV